MNNSVLILIDLQNDYLPEGKFPLDNILSVMQKNKEILLAARQKRIPLIHVRHEFPDGDAPFFGAGTYGADICEAVRPLAKEMVMTKHYPNAFKDTDLKKILDQNRYENLIITGAMSQMCIDATARAAMDDGYGVSIIHDAVASHYAQFQEINVSAQLVQAAFMHALALCGARIMDADQLVNQWDQ